MAFITLHKTNFFNNLDIIAAKAGDKDKVALVLKDNAYGHGLLEIARMANEYGIRRAVVRKMDEARLIAPYFDYILLLDEIGDDMRFRYTINALAQIDRLPRGMRVELKVDTGMHRNGVAYEEVDSALALIVKRGLTCKAIFTHYRSADELSSEFFWQKKRFELLKKTYGDFLFHSYNSAALFRSRSCDEAMVRVGIAAYGCLELPRPFDRTQLRPVLSLYGEKIATRKLAKGERIGYGGIYEAKRDETVSTYDIGYADGLLRSASNGYSAPHRERLLGRISMDNVSFTGDKERLLLFDDARSFAKAAGTIPYEVLTGLNRAIKRVIRE